jgi:putative ABC transport system permease protein
MTTFAGGSGFGGDGYMMVSDQTFLSLFPSAVPPRPIISCCAAPRRGCRRIVAAAARPDLGPDLRIRSYADAAQEDLRYQQTQRPRA